MVLALGLEQTVVVLGMAVPSLHYEHRPASAREGGRVMTDETLLDRLADVLLAGPDLDAPPSGEWGRTVARGYARRVLAAGWRPTNVPPAEVAVPPRAARGASPPAAGGTQAPEVNGG